MNRKKIIYVTPVVCIILLAAISTNANNNNKTTIKEAAEYAENEFILQDEVTGVSYTENPDKVIIYIENESFLNIVPEKFKDYETEIRISGRFEIISSSQKNIQLSSKQLSGPRDERWDPLVGGISVGNIHSGSGTLSVVIKQNSKKYILGCTHVLAMHRYSLLDYLPLGTRIVQPAGTKGDVVGYLSKYSRIWFERYPLKDNYVDAALARCIVDAKVNEVLDSDNQNTYTVDIMNNYVPEIGERVIKSGKRTGITENEVIDTHATCRIWYWDDLTIFHDQVLVNNPFVDSGDSGSIVSEKVSPYRCVGLAFAASMEFTIICKASGICNTLNIKQSSKETDFEYRGLLNLISEEFPLLKILLRISNLREFLHGF